MCILFYSYTFSLFQFRRKKQQNTTTGHCFYSILHTFTGNNNKYKNMKTSSFIRSLRVGVLCILATYTSLWAQYPTTSYKLSTDGSTLEKWLGDETEINLTEAPLNAVQQIGEKAFSSNRDLQKIILGPSVKKIGRSAFDDCTMLSSIKIPPSLRVIEEDAFHGCKKLARIDLESVEEIGGSAFSLCRSLTTITIPQSLKKIGYAAFYGCSKVNKIEVEAQNSFFIAENNLLYNKDKSLLIMAPQGIIFEELRIPETVIEISGRAFDGCKIKTIVLPARLERIGAASFFKCSQLQTITVEAAIPPSCVGNDSFAMVNVEQCTLRVPATSLEHTNHRLLGVISVPLSSNFFYYHPIDKSDHRS